MPVAGREPLTLKEGEGRIPVNLLAFEIPPYRNRDLETQNWKHDVEYGPRDFPSVKCHLMSQVPELDSLDESLPEPLDAGRAKAYEPVYLSRN